MYIKCRTLGAVLFTFKFDKKTSIKHNISIKDKRVVFFEIQIGGFN